MLSNPPAAQEYVGLDKGLLALGWSWAHAQPSSFPPLYQISGREEESYCGEDGQEGEKLRAVCSGGRLLITLWALMDV